MFAVLCEMSPSIVTIEVTGQYGIGGKYEKLESNAMAAAAGNNGKQFKISVAGSAEQEITLTGTDTGEDVANKIRALNIAGLNIVTDGGQ